jgi:membrane-associated phospholipid phosphatase
MLESLVSWVNVLNNPYFVARIQKSFGIQLVEVVKSKDTQENNGHTRLNVDTQNSGKLKQVDLLNDNKCIYTVNNRFFYWFFMIITRLGNEIFYIIFLPVLLWLYDEKNTYLTCIAWSIVMYIGQATKDVIRMPRPATPPVVKMEDKYLLEYGFPSTHAMAATTISFTLMTFFFRDLNSIARNNTTQFLVLCSIAIMTTFFVCLSRVYLGMHSLLDIFGGILYSLIISSLFVKVSDPLDEFLKKGVLPGLLFVALIILICLMYPSKHRWSPARADTFLIMGVAVGVVMGISIKHQFGLETTGKMRNQNINSTSLYISRTVIGLICVLAARFVSKSLILKFFRFYLRKSHSNIESDANVKKLIEKKFEFELIYYLFCYSNVSFTGFFTSFILFEYFRVV